MTVQIFNPSSSGSATINTVDATIDFGFAGGQEGTNASTTVTATWVTSSTTIDCIVLAVDTPDHSAEEAMLEDLEAFATNIVPGVGFDIEVVAPNNTWGRYSVRAVGEG